MVVDVVVFVAVADEDHSGHDDEDVYGHGHCHVQDLLLSRLSVRGFALPVPAGAPTLPATLSR